MSKRTDLNAMLKTILGSNNVYYQPPESIKMSYPAIIYGKNKINALYANDNPTPYKRDDQYSITVIDKDPDSIIAEKMINTKYCSFDRQFKADNLNHFVFTLYY